MLRKPETIRTLVRIRERQEDLRAQALAGARHAVTHAEQQRESILQMQRDTLEQARETAQRHFDASDVRRYYQYERYLSRLADVKDAEIRKLEAQAEQRRRELEEALKQRRMMEKLHERAEEARLRSFRQFEQKALDEVAVNYSTQPGTETKP